MTTTLDEIFSDVDARVSATREIAIANYHRKAGAVSAGSPAASGVAGAASPFGGDGLFGDGTQSTSERQYAAATKDTAAIAIRPIATRIANQVIRAGTKKAAGAPSVGMMSKDMSEYTLKHAPQAIQHKAISEGIRVLDSHPFLDAIENPNPLFSQWSLMLCTAWSIVACGEALWFIDPTNDENGDPTIRIWYYPRNWAQPIHDEDMAFKAWKLMPPGVAGDLPDVPAELVCHFFCPHPGNPLKALSTVQTQAKSINVEEKIRDAHVAAMHNIIEPGMILIAGEMDELHPVTKEPVQISLEPEQRKQIIEAIKLVYRGVAHFGEPLILDKVIKDAKPYRANPTDLALQEGYMLVNRSIMQGIGTSKIIAGETEGANRASSYVADEIFVSNLVNPFITLMSQTMTRTFGRLESMRPARKNTSLVLWIEEAKPHDADLELKQMAFLAGKNWLRPSEAREKFDLTPEPELDEQWEERRKNPPVSPMSGTRTQGKPGNKPGDEPGGEPGEGKDFSDATEKRRDGTWVGPESTPNYHALKEKIKNGKARCAKCKSKRKLLVHHIDDNSKNDRPSNLQVLCDGCHRGLGRRALEPSELQFHDDGESEMVRKAGGYQPPESAKNNASRVLKWKKEHGDDVKGMTSVGWGRARQLASGKSISIETVKKMAQFNRHRSNYEKARAKQKRENGNPWEYAGIVAWLGWGGSSGINWAIKTSETNKKSADASNMDRQSNTIAELAKAITDRINPYTLKPLDFGDGKKSD